MDRGQTLLDLAAEVLGRSPYTLRTAAQHGPFVTLGGGLGQGLSLLAAAEQRLELAVELPALLGPEPLADVLGRAVPVPRGATEHSAPAPRTRPVTAVQHAWLTAARERPGAAHRLSALELTGPLDVAALRTALRAVVARHQGLRTVFDWSPEGPVRHVLVCAEPYLVVRRMSAGPGASRQEHVAAALDAVGRSSAELLGYPGRPPVAFVLTPLSDHRHLLCCVVHAALADAWSVGLMWRQLLSGYAAAVAGSPLDERSAPDPDPVPQAAGHPALSAPEAAGRPAVLAPPRGKPRQAPGERVRFGLPDGLREGCERLAERAGVPRSAVLLGAWALTLGLPADAEQVLLGVPLPVGTTGGRLRTVAPGSAVLPIRLELLGPVDYFLRGVVCALSEGMRPARIPAPCGLRLGFTAEDDLLPDRFPPAAGLHARLHSGSCGSAPADLGLTVLRWGGTPLLALDHTAGAATRAEAAALVAGFQRTLAALTRLPENAPLDRVPAAEPRPAVPV